MQITSAVFDNGNQIPARYTCDGRNVSPPLKWTNVPPATKSLVLIAEDPDAAAGTWVHWVLYGLAPNLAELPEGLPRDQYVMGGARQGLNDFRHLGYGGPCPPQGKPHRYFFRLYALGAEIDLPPGAIKGNVVRGLEPHLLGEGELMGTYQRAQGTP